MTLSRSCANECFNRNRVLMMTNQAWVLLFHSQHLGGGGLFAQTFYVCFYCWHFLKENMVLRPDSLRQFFCVQRNFASTQHRFFFSLLPTVARFLFYAFWFATFWGEKHESCHIQTLSSSRLPKHSRILENPLWSVAKFGSFFLWMVLPFRFDLIKILVKKLFNIQ